MNSDSASQKSPAGAVECDPKGRYWRFEDVLGRGAFKTVFKAFDYREGTEVAWNKVPLTLAVNEDPDRKRLFSEIHVLKRLKHKNIMTFHDYWLDEKTNTLNFITELFTHGSLKKFRAKHKHLELKVLKKWAWQILQGLVYLHGHEPPIIHRDLKCDNILINGVSGDLKIGDLGLATLVKGLEVPLSVIGTPEFMAPEFYNEKYDEKVDVYAFGMLLLELVSMDYPYCECTNPAAIYKRVSQGVFPASIQKIRNEELRKFIELCIAYEPTERPEARKLLKHDFFNDIRRGMEPERLSFDEMDVEPLTRGSDISDSLDSPIVDPLSKQDSMNFPFSSDSDEEEHDDDQSVATSDGVKIRIECFKVEGEPTLHFTLRYARPGGISKNIEFPFDINDDTAEQIVAEMRAEGSTDLDIMITEEEANTIGHLIASEVERWRLKDEGELTAYVNVVRKPCDGEEPVHALVPVDSLEVRDNFESQMDDMCQTMASDLTEDHVFRTLDENTRALMDIVAADNSRRSLKHKLEDFDDEEPSDEFLETNVVFIPRDEQPAEEFREFSNRSVGGDSASSSAIDIPRKRRVSTSSLERSHSISSTISESRLHFSYEGRSPAVGRSIQRRISGRQFLSEGPSSINLRPSFLRSISMTVESSSNPAESPLKVSTPQVPVELSVFVVEPKPESDSLNVAGHDTGVENEKGLESRQGSNTSLISMVTMKPTPKKGLEGCMPTVPEITATQMTEPHRRPRRRKPDPSAARSKADEWQWILANEPIVTDMESATSLSQAHSVGYSPQNSFRRVDSCGSTVDHGIKSPSLSQEGDSCGRSDRHAPRGPRSGVMEGRSGGSGASSVVGQSIEEVKVVERHEQEQAVKAQTATQALVLGHQSPETGPGSAMHSSKSWDWTADAWDYHAAFMPPPPQDCRSVYELAGGWQTESIRAFRRDEGATVVAGPSFRAGGPLRWPKNQMSREAKQSVNRMFNSCADLTCLLSGRSNSDTLFFYPEGHGFDRAFHTSPSEIDLARLADPHPFLNLAPPIVRKGSHPEEGKSALGLGKQVSEDGNSWTGLVDEPIAEDRRKEHISCPKELRRQKARKDIDKMQHEQLAGLCSGASVGVASSKPKGGKSQRLSMNGTFRL